MPFSADPFAGRSASSSYAATSFSYPPRPSETSARSPMPTTKSFFLARLYRTFVTYFTIVVIFPFSLILLLELLLAMRACLVAGVGLFSFSGCALVQHGLPPLPIVCDIISTYFKTAALGGTRFALMFAPSFLIVGVGAAAMHAAGAHWKPSHIIHHLGVANFKTSVSGGIASVVCDIGVGCVFLPMGSHNFLGLQHGVGKGTGVAAEHPLMSLMIGLVGSAVLSTHQLMKDMAKSTKHKKSREKPLGSKNPSILEKSPPPSFIEELLPWEDIDRVFADFSTRP